MPGEGLSMSVSVKVKAALVNEDAVLALGKAISLAGRIENTLPREGQKLVRLLRKVSRGLEFVSADDPRVVDSE